MQSLALLKIITPFFRRIFCSSSQAFWSWSRSDVMIAGKSSSVQWLLVADQTCDNPIWARYRLYWGCGKSSNFSCLHASTIASTECGRSLSWRRRTPLDCIRLRFLLKFSNKLHVLTLLGRKKRITARCSTAVQFESGVAIFKEHL
jgi:hypothetical protein